MGFNSGFKGLKALLVIYTFNFFLELCRYCGFLKTTSSKIILSLTL